jgi:L-lactate dehydrogenase complex protein LldG
VTSRSRESILQRLRESLDSVDRLFREDRVARPKTLVTVAPVEGDATHLAEHFGSNLTEVSGTYEIVMDAVEVAGSVTSRIRDWLPERRETPIEVLSWAPSELPIEGLESQLRESGVVLVAPTDLHDGQIRSQAAALTVGITSVDAAFAGTGSIVLAAGPSKNRAAALFPLHHIALIPFSRIYPTFETWIHSLRQKGELDTFLRHNSQVAFITGPSKTADIELKLTLGVHGPKNIHAIVFSDA